ncbi:MAG: polysaccharide biosynthesis/export family protein [Acidobacteria bacterium]|nr:polysaccharide biosynthesis/export family protein [Acidobacteriota bacterium]
MPFHSRRLSLRRMWCAAWLIAATAVSVDAAIAQAPAPGSAPAPSQVPAASASERAYQVGPNDVLLITVFGQPDLTGRYTVGADGVFAFPLVGRVKAGGLSVRDLEMTLTGLLSPDYLRNPQVSIAVETYRSQQFFVLGEVNQPGSFYLSGQETLIQALARAGSTKPDAGDEVLIVRPRAGAAGGPVRPDQAGAADVRRVSLDALSTGNLAENVQIQAGDTIFVTRAEQVFILGQVKNPGPYRYSRTVTVLQYLSMAGGATDRGATSRVKIVRTMNGKQLELKVTLNDTVQANDTIMVPEKFF